MPRTYQSDKLLLSILIELQIYISFSQINQDCDFIAEKIRIKAYWALKKIKHFDLKRNIG